MSTSNDFSKYYDLLGIDRDAALSEVKQAYRDLIADYQAGSSKLNESELEEIEVAYMKLRQQLQDSSTSAKSTSLSSRKSSLADVPWGPIAAILVAGLAFFGADAVAFLLFSGTAMILEDVGFEAASSLVSGGNTMLMFGMYLLSTISAAVAIVLYVRYKGGGFAALGFRRFKPSTALLVVFLGIVGYYIGAGLLLFLVEILPTGIDTQTQQDIPFAPAGNVELLATFIAIVLLAPIVEELLFRGFLLPALNKVMRLPFAIVAVSILFAVLHPPIMTMLAIGVFSVFLCLAYVKTGSLWPAILLHSTQNLIAFTLLFVVDIEQYLPADAVPSLLGSLIAV